MTTDYIRGAEAMREAAAQSVENQAGWIGAVKEIVGAIRALPIQPDPAPRRFAIGDRVTKIKGSAWTGRVCGFYSTKLTPVGYAVESENEREAVQIYPEIALIEAPAAPAPSARDAAVRGLVEALREVAGWLEGKPVTRWYSVPQAVHTARAALAAAEAAGIGGE